MHAPLWFSWGGHGFAAVCGLLGMEGLTISRVSNGCAIMEKVGACLVLIDLRYLRLSVNSVQGLVACIRGS